ncbi:TetR/AcrR family transcriptional regulator [Microbacterium yannicii]|uniref:TetR/AcrR family transcriptional regulator n=1 Tax=Microbacterium yannicii TaxID=671622 RepID=UPI0002F4BB81|nr:TetR/AcrR family transcriptional regulator [Microbacterium yannicii]
MVSSPSSTTLRADAERNRLAVICAAAAVFSERGLDAPLEEVAREARVGIATLYRRFPTRASLVEAVFDEKMAAYAHQARLAADRSLTEPWDALASYVTYILTQQARDPAFAEVLIAPDSGSPVFATLQRRAFVSTVLLAERVREAGVVRADFDHSDLFVMTLANRGIVQSAGAGRAEASRRFCALILDGFRASRS